MSQKVPIANKKHSHRFPIRTHVLTFLNHPDCPGCLSLSQKIVELEGRITTLHEIKVDEELIDSLLQSVVPEAAVNATLPASSTLAAPSVPTDWLILGAKPSPMPHVVNTSHHDSSA